MFELRLKEILGVNLVKRWRGKIHSLQLDQPVRARMGVSVAGVERGSLVGDEARERGRGRGKGIFAIFLRTKGKVSAGLLGKGETLIGTDL